MSSIASNNQVVRVVWFPNHGHSEIAIKDNLHYYIGEIDRYDERKLSTAIERASQTPVVVFSIPLMDSVHKLEEKIRENPPSRWNTCMGSVAEIVNAFSILKIPSVFRQSPELSALYLMTRSHLHQDVAAEYHGLSKKEAIQQAIKGGAIHIAVGVLAITSLVLPIIS